MEAYQHGASYTAGWLSDFEEQTTLITHHAVPKHGCCKATGIWGMFVSTALFSLSWLICHLHHRYWSVEFYEALLQRFSLWLKFPHFFSPLTHSFSFIYSFIHSYIYTSNTGGGGREMPSMWQVKSLLSGSSHSSFDWVASLANIPLEPSQPPSHTIQRWKGIGRERDEVLRGQPLRSRICISVFCFPFI